MSKKIDARDLLNAFRQEDPSGRRVHAELKRIKASGMAGGMQITKKGHASLDKAITNARKPRTKEQKAQHAAVQRHSYYKKQFERGEDKQAY